MADLTETQKAYAQCVRDARARAGLSQGELSRHCGGSPSRVTINRIENHVQPCSAETFERLAGALKLTLRVEQQGCLIATIGPVKVHRKEQQQRKAS